MRLIPLAWVICTAAVAAEWPSWRGPAFDGVASEPPAVTSWSKTENVRWRAELPEPGNSTPVVWGNRIFVTQPRKAAGLRSLMCFHRDSGKLLWERSAKWTAEEPTHATNPYASASPVTDGERVIAWFGSAGVLAFDLDGKELWRRDLGTQRHTWGYASSPVIHGAHVFLNFGPGERQFLVALDKTTGKTAWQVDYPKAEGVKFANWDPKDMYGSWSTPLVVRAGGRDELIVTTPRKVRAFDPASGKELWSCEGLGDLVYPSPLLGRTAAGDPVIFAPSGFSGPILAVKPGGDGDVTATHRLWHQPRSKNMIGSGIVRDGYLYLVDTNGVAHCLNLATGETAWSQRLPAKAEDNNVWSSLVMAGDRLYIMNKSAHTVVFQANPKQFEAVSINVLDEPTNSSVVMAGDGGSILLRTHAALWSIGGK